MSDADVNAVGAGPGMSGEREYWWGKLSGRAGRAALVSDRRVGDGAARARGSVRLAADADLSAKLDRLTGGKPFLLYAALVAGLKVCLHKYTGETEVAVGSPARRHDEESCAANALAILDHIDGRVSFKQVLVSVRQSLLEAYARQHYPFGLLLIDLGLSSTKDSCPLFSVAAVLEEIHGDLPDIGNEMTFTFRAGPDGLVGEVSFDGGLYTPETVGRFARHFLELLRGGLASPDAPVSRLSFMSDEELDDLLKRRNDTRRDAPQVPCVHDLFEEQAGRTPRAVALTFGDESLTYEALNERANKLARYLRQLGVGPEQKVLVLLERSFELVVSILATLKAGGAYVPLDPEAPPERVLTVLKDAGASVVLTQERLAQLFAGSGAALVSVDGQWEEIGREDGSRLEGGAAGESLAYVVYTSGSTGRPKGVMVGHAALVNYVCAARAAFGLGPGDRMLQFLSPAFDAFGEELYPTLSSGAALVLHERPAEMSAAELLDACERAGVTVLHFGALYFSRLAEEVARSGHPVPEGIRLVVVGGESLPGVTLRRWRAAAPACRVLNAYGPSEATVTAALYEAGLADEAARRVPVGRSVAGMRAYVLGSGMAPVPEGAAGELYLGGAGLARGYLGDAALTAERFVPDPHTGEAGARLYRTGDGARWGVGGVLEFLGRGDEQVKVRGHRVELGEVEAALLREEWVRGAAVVADETPGGETRLIAYVVPAADGGNADGAGAAAASGEWNRSLGKYLPGYMLPAEYVLIESLPLSLHGKVNKGALPPPPSLAQGSRRPYVAPRTETEEKLAAIWAELFKLERVGVEDDFLELGGHSLRAFQLVSRVREAFGVELPPGSVFETTTIAGQATLIVWKLAEQSDAEKLEQLMAEIEGLPSAEQGAG